MMDVDCQDCGAPPCTGCICGLEEDEKYEKQVAARRAEQGDDVCACTWQGPSQVVEVAEVLATEALDSPKTHHACGEIWIYGQHYCRVLGGYS